MKLIEFFKKLFKRNKQKEINYSPKQSGYHDVFGNIIFSDEEVYPITYLDVKRRGYFTIRTNEHSYLPNELTPKLLKNGVIKHRDVVLAGLNGKMKLGKRKEFYHYNCSFRELNATQNHKHKNQWLNQ